MAKPRDPEKERLKRLMALYGLTGADYDLMLAQQKGACAICGKPPKEWGIKLSVDHAHGGADGGLIRGLLCWTCNRVLGVIERWPGLAAAALAYLNQPPAVLAFQGRRHTLPGRTTSKARAKMYRKLRRMGTVLPRGIL